MNDFIPNTPKESKKVPYYDDVTSAEGWQGHETGKGINKLKSEVSEAIVRLGGMVSGFQEGSFGNRDGYRVHYTIELPNGGFAQGRIDIAALPVRDSYRIRASMERRREASLKMALYMLREALNGTWFLQQLSPGYAPLMPFMIGVGDKTISQLWGESAMMSNLLPPPADEFVDGEIQE